jgi:hypothetical protein
MMAILLLGIALRVAWVGRPLDHRIRAPWRQADYTQIARNFAREDPDLIHPRIDWRRDGPGLVEMEFPLVPWTAGMLDRLFGYREQYLRLLSCLFEVGGLLLFAGLARRLLPTAGALAAVGFYAVNPLLVYLSTAMQPEPMMLFLSLLAIVLLERYSREGKASALLLAGAALGGAILGKAPAACLGLVFTWVVLRRLGRRAATSPLVWGAAALALVPPLLWYHWARGLFLIYGNSLGLSNEDPFLGLDMLRRPVFILGLLKWETLGVATPIGWLLLVAALRAPRAATALSFAWLLSVWTFYVAGARTTADDWAFYYHSASVAPFCLLMGAGCSTLLAPAGSRVLGVSPGAGRRSLGWLLCGATGLALVLATVALLHARDEREDLREMRACGLRFLERIPEGSMIVARGGSVADDAGHPTAHNQSMLFAWLDRRGFTYGNEELSIPLLQGIARRGGRYWIAETNELGGETGAGSARQFRLLDRCGPRYVLYDLGAPPDQASR